MDTDIRRQTDRQTEGGDRETQAYSGRQKERERQREKERASQ
jgi:hypothetical protein